MSLARRYAPKTVADYDQEEAVLTSVIRHGRLPGSGLDVSLTPQGAARAHQELAQVRRRRLTAMIAGAR